MGAYADLLPDSSDSANTSSSVARSSGNQRVDAFVEQYRPIAERVAEQTGNDPELYLAKWGLETGWGKSIIPGTNNLGNIKDFSGSGVSAKDNATGSVDRYRQYKDANQFADDYASLLNRRYKNALNVGSDMDTFATELKRAGYAEDPNYVSKLKSAYNMLGGSAAQSDASQPSPNAHGEYEPRTDYSAALRQFDKVPNDTYEANRLASTPKGMSISKEISAAIDSYQANLWSIPAAMGSEYALNAMLENKSAAEQQWADSGAPQSFSEMEFGKNFGQYFAHMAIQSAPYMLEFIASGFGVGSLAKGALANTAKGVAEKAAIEAAKQGATKEAAKKAGEVAAKEFMGTVYTASGVAGSYPSAVGDVLSNQYEESGKFNLPAAAALGVPYAALNAAGAEGMLTRGLARGLPKTSLTAKGAAGFAGRAALTGAEAGVMEGSTETGQEVMNQLGRMAVNPDAKIDDKRALEAYKESFIAGTLLGGVTGAVAGGFRKPEDANLQPPAPVANSPLSSAVNTAQHVEKQRQQAAVDDNLEQILGMIAQRDDLTERIAGLQNMIDRADPSSEDGQRIRAMQSDMQMRRDSLVAQLDAAKAFYGGDQTANVGPTNDPLILGNEQMSRIYQVTQNLLNDPASLDPESRSGLLKGFSVMRNRTLPEATRIDAAISLIATMDDMAARRAAAASGRADEREWNAFASDEAARDGEASRVAPNQQQGVVTQSAPALATDERARKAAAAEYEAAYQDLVKAEQLGVSDQELMQRQIAMRNAENRLQEINEAIEANRAKETAEKRGALLDRVLASNPGNPNRAFDRALRLEGFRDATFSEEEKAKIAHFNALRAAIANPTAPGFDPVAGVPAGRYQHLSGMLDSGWLPANRGQLVSPTGEVYGLKGAGEMQFVRNRLNQKAGNGNQTVGDDPQGSGAQGDLGAGSQGIDGNVSQGDENGSPGSGQDQNPATPDGAVQPAEAAGNGSAPNGKVDPGQWLNEEDELNSWFGNSVVVGPDGRPMTVYHTTYKVMDEAISEFDRNHLTKINPDTGRRRKSPSLDSVGVWFSNNPAKTDAYGEGAQYPAHLKITRPVVYRTFDDLLKDWNNFHAKGFADPKLAELHQKQNEFFGDADGFVANLKQRGFDGLIILPHERAAAGDNMGSTEFKDQTAYIVFDGSQIRSVFDRRQGEFVAAESEQVAQEAQETNDAQAEQASAAAPETEGLAAQDGNNPAITKPENARRNIIANGGVVEETQAINNVEYPELPGITFFTRQTPEGKFNVVDERSGYAVFIGAPSEEEAINNFRTRVVELGIDNVRARLESQKAIDAPKQETDVPVQGIAAQAPSVAQPAPNTQPQGQGGTPATAQQAGPAATSPEGFDVSKRTDAQLTWLSGHGQPGWKEAAVAELQKRSSVVAGQKATGSESTAAQNAVDSANRFDAKGLQPGTPEYNAAYQAWMDSRSQIREDSSKNRQREENQSAIDKKNKWRNKLRDWFNSAEDGDSITDVTGQRYVVVTKVRRDGTSTKTLIAVDDSGVPLPDGRAATGIAKIGDRLYGLNDGSLDVDTGSAHPESAGQSFASSLGQQLETGEAKTGKSKSNIPNGDGITSQAPVANVPDTQQATEQKTETPEPASDIQRDRNGYAKVGGYYVTPYEDKFVVRESSGTIHRVDGKQVGFASEQEAIDYAKGVSSKPAPKAPTEGGPEDSIGWTRMTIVEREGLLIRAGYGGKGRALNLGGAGAINRSWENMGKGIREKLIAAHESRYSQPEQAKGQEPAKDDHDKAIGKMAAEWKQNPSAKSETLLFIGGEQVGVVSRARSPGTSDWGWRGTLSQELHFTPDKAMEAEERAARAHLDNRAAVKKMELSQQKTDAEPETDEEKAVSDTQELTHNGVRIYPISVNVGGERKQMWGIESAENKAKREAGERHGFGDSLVDTPEQAKAAADRMIADTEAQSKYDEAQKAKQEEEAKRKADIEADTFNGFLDGKTPAKKGLIRKALAKQWRFDGVVMTARERIESLLANGQLEVGSFEEDKIKPMTRAQFNRATQREQDAHEKKVREGGKVTVYTVSGSELGKIAHDYAQHLLSQKSPVSQQKTDTAAEPAAQQATAITAENDIEKLANDFRTYPTQVLSAVINNGQAPMLYKAAGVRSADAFSGLPIADQAEAYAKFVQDGGAKAKGLPADYNEWVRSQESDAESRRMQSERTIRQSNGKPFKTEAGAKQAIERFGLAETHEVNPVDGGFELQKLTPAAQLERRRKAEGKESYAEAQEAVMRQLGIEANGDGEYDLTEDQWANVERHVDARLRGNSSQQKTDTAPKASEQAAPVSQPENDKPAYADDAELQDALSHLGDVLGDVFGAKLNITGKQYGASDLLPAMSKVIELLIKKGFKSFRESVGAATNAMRGNANTKGFVDQITPRQWKAAYNSVAEFHEGTDSEEDVAKYSAEQIQKIIALPEKIKEAEQATNHDATPGQKEAGNYAKGKFAWHGLNIAVETAKGEDRTDKETNGEKWRVTMPATYGYILGTVGADKDHVDVFMGDKPESQRVYVVNQTKPGSTEFDEHKVMLGYDSEGAAIGDYLLSFTGTFGHSVLGSISGPYSIDDFKSMLESNRLKHAKPISDRLAYVNPRVEESNQLPPGVRINGAKEKAAAERLAQLLDKMDQVRMDRNTPEGAAKGSIRSAIEELRKERSVGDIPGLLDTAAQRLFRRYSAFSDVASEVAESLRAADKYAETVAKFKAKQESGIALSDIEVDRQSNGTGRIKTYKQRADEALSEIDERMGLGKQLLECLNS